MVRMSAPVFALACAAAFVGIWADPIRAQDEEPAPRVTRPRPRAQVPVRRPVAEAAENAENSPAETPAVPQRRNARIPRGQNAAQPMRLPNIDPQLLQILRDWEQHSSATKELYGSLHRETFDWTFQTEKHAEGSFAYRAPDQGIFRVVNYSVDPNANRKARKNPKSGQGVVLALAEDKPEHWICTGQELYNIDHVQRTYEVAPIPPENRGQAIMDTPLPFLFGMKEKQARARYDMSFLVVPEKTPGLAKIRVKPLWQSDAANYKEAWVVLDLKTYMPTAVRLLDPAGTTETIYKFSNCTEKGPLFKDVFKERPKSSYRRVQTAEGKPQSNSATPAGRRAEKPAP